MSVSAVDYQTQAALAQGEATRLQNNLRPQQLSPELALRTAQDFEAVFITQFISTMFKGIPTDGPFQGGFGEGVWREQMFTHYGKSIAQMGGFGIADQIYRQIIQASDTAPSPAKPMDSSAMAAYGMASARAAQIGVGEDPHRDRVEREIAEEELSSGEVYAREDD